MEEGEGHVQSADQHVGSPLTSRENDKEEFIFGTLDLLTDEIMLQDNLSYTDLLRGHITLRPKIKTADSSSSNIMQVQSRTGENNNGNPIFEDSFYIHKSYNAQETEATGNEQFSTPNEGSIFTTHSREGGSSGGYNVCQEQSRSSTKISSNMVQENPWDTALFNDLLLEQVHPGNSNITCETAERTDKHHANTEERDNPDINDEDIDNFLHNESQDDEEAQMQPVKGMTFKSREEAQDFFNMYAFVAGFSVTIVSLYRTTSKQRNREVIRVTMKCNKHGKTEERDREEVVLKRQTTVIAKTDCKVEMVICERNSLWEITTLVLEHNHSLSPQSRFFRSHAYMSEEEKLMIKTLKRNNIPTRCIVAVLADIRGGMKQLPYNKKKVSNYATSVNREVQNCDMMESLEFFNKKLAEDPGFYYSFEFDNNKQVRSIFWTEARSRKTYETCGDCVSFDTTYLTNKYNLPFAPFVGVSPHGNTYLFACAFIVDETANTFRWQFRQFLTAMGGKHPESIITDQDRAMRAAIRDVFPNATHRTCLFHVKKKAEEKMSSCFRANEGLYEEFQDIVDNSLTIEEFEMLWQQMIETYDVGHVKYFSDMWAAKQRFVPVYFKSKFFPFIQTTARSEGTNALFKKGVGAKFSVTSFLREYQRIMDVIHAREDEFDHNTKNKKVPDKKYYTKYYIERQAHSLYNIGIFRKFQKKLEDVTRLQLEEEHPYSVYWVFQAKNCHLKEHRSRKYRVQIDLGLEEYSCICCCFEKDGILCSHILKVMLHINIDKIPDKYLIDRWRKKDKKMVKIQPPEIDTDNITLRYNVLSKHFNSVASDGSKSKQLYHYLLGELPRLQEGMSKIDNQPVQVAQEQDDVHVTVTSETTSTCDEGTTSTMQLQDPRNANMKGRPRLLTIREQIKQNKFYKCSHCSGNNHTLKNCPNKHLEYGDKNKNKPRKTRPKATANQGSVGKTLQESRKRARRTVAKDNTGKTGPEDGIIQKDIEIAEG